MPNIATVLKEEITRLARKEVRAQLEGVKQTTSKSRKEIVALKRQVSQLERQVKKLESQVVSNVEKAPESKEEPTTRFTSKGLKSQRSRLGLSASDYAKLAGVSALTIYNFENGKSNPRSAQLAKMASLRGLGKKEASARLKALKEAAVAKAKPKKKRASGKKK